MYDVKTSTVSFTSNLQPVRGTYREDSAFRQCVHDIFALELLEKAGYALSPIQRQEYNNASLHCAYAYDDDYPFGTIRDSNGIESVVCRCTNTKCHLFSKCRPDFDHNELCITEENQTFTHQINDLNESLLEYENENRDSQEDNSDEIRSLSGRETDIEVGLDDSESMQPSNAELSGSTAELDVAQEPSDRPVLPDATFSSFIETTQKEIITLPVNERTVVNAGPGTGKTWTLIEKIKYMLTVMEIDPADILVLCFSRSAVEVIRNRLKAASDRDELPMTWQQLDVRTFDSFSTYLLAWAQENIPRYIPKHFILEAQSYDERILLASQIINRKADLLSEYRHIIVDEVQDLVGVRAELVLSIINSLSVECGFTLLGDSCQALYDYLAIDNASVMSSEEFYKAILHNYKNANRFSLTHNYRQGDEFGELSIPYRKAILSEDNLLLANEARKLNEELTVSNIDLRNIAPADFNSFTNNGTLGILCRTNGQALQISSWLRSEGVQHALQRPVHSHELAAWIARTLMNAETDVIDYAEFNEVFTRFYPQFSYSSRLYWDALIGTQRDQTKAHYEIEDLLRGLFQNPRNPLLFEEPGENNNSITISNIHRAKGQEFDSVLVLQDVVESMTDPDNCDLLEHKVCYVAITRPKKRIEKIKLKPQYIYISKDEKRRCFKAGGYSSRRYLSHFEVGEGSDFNVRSYAKTVEVQEYLKTLKRDTRLKLLKCPESTYSYVSYRIVPEDDERRTIGYTSAYFYRDLESAIQRIYSNYHHIAYKYFPNVFGEIYIDGLTTCISSSDTGLEGAKRYGDMCLWYGLSISGFAQRENDRY